MFLGLNRQEKVQTTEDKNYTQYRFRSSMQIFIIRFQLLNISSRDSQSIFNFIF